MGNLQFTSAGHTQLHGNAIMITSTITVVLFSTMVWCSRLTPISPTLCFLYTCMCIFLCLFVCALLVITSWRVPTPSVFDDTRQSELLHRCHNLFYCLLAWGLAVNKYYCSSLIHHLCWKSLLVVSILITFMFRRDYDCFLTLINTVFC